MQDEDHDPIKRWSTGSVPQPKRLDYFAAALSEAIYPVALTHGDPQSFRAEASLARLGSVDVCKATGSPHAGARGRQELARTGDHRFNLLMTLQSPWTAHHRGSLRMLQRDVLIIDSEHPLKVDIDEAFVAINVVAPDSWVRQWLPNPHLVAAKRIPGNSLWGHALSSFLSELSPELAAAPPLPLSVIADQVGSLLALTASGLMQLTEESTPATRSLHKRIDDCLAQRCTEWQLTAADVASALNISVRTLHRALAAANETFGRRLIDARAQVALRMLTSRLFRRVTTGEIGRRAGFSSASHFARVVRSRTGKTPLQLRRAAETSSSDEV
ncbi:AraC family transcriptional regulator [Bradyrhizobium sp. Arg314]